MGRTARDEVQHMYFKLAVCSGPVRLQPVATGCRVGGKKLGTVRSGGLLGVVCFVTVGGQLHQKIAKDRTPSQLAFQKGHVKR